MRACLFGFRVIERRNEFTVVTIRSKLDKYFKDIFYHSTSQFQDEKTSEFNFYKLNHSFLPFLV